MATNYNLPKPTAGTPRAGEEVSLMVDVSDTVADIDTRITGEASARASADDALDTRVGSIEADYTTAAELGAAVDNATSRVVDEVDRLSEVRAATIAPLIAGQPDESPTVTGSTLSADTVNVLSGVQSWKLAITSGTTATIKLPALTQRAFQEHLTGISLLCYIPDVTAIDAITAQIYTGTGDVNYWQFVFSGMRGGLAGNLTNGWNYLRMPAHKRSASGSPAAWGNVDHVRVVFVTNKAADISVQRFAVESRQKASMIFIHDGGYSAFDTSPGYADLKSREIPVTWSVDCGLIGDASHVTDARLAEIAAENRNSISFHGWDSATTSDMTKAQTQGATVKAIKWLAARGYTGRIWRSAWMQNTAPHSEATNSYVLANAMFGTTEETLHMWPFQDRYNVARTQLHGKTDAQFDAWFTELELTRGVLVCYTHRVNDAGGTDMTNAEWAYFLSKVDAAVDAGWLEPTTFERLLAESGVQVRTGLDGGLVAEWPTFDGTPEVLVLP